MRLLRLLFAPFWFLILPLGLSIAMVALIGIDPASFPENGIDNLRRWIGGQKIPAVILFFVIFETLLYRARYSLPLAAELGIAGRPGLPAKDRKAFENAHQLVEAMERTMSKHQKKVAEKLSAEEQEKGKAAALRLHEVMHAEEFDLQAFERAHEKAAVFYEKYLSQFGGGETREVLETLLIALAVALLVRAHVFEAFKIPTGSMLPTLQIQDHLFVNKMAYGLKLPFVGRVLTDLPPERADIVVFVNPDPPSGSEPDDYIKRTIALPGDTLEVRDGFPIINGFEVPHCAVGDYDYVDHRTGHVIASELYVEFLGERAYLVQFRGGRREGSYAKYRIKEGEFWVLGDNRNDSRDSRLWFNGKGGGVPFDNVKGRANFVFASFGDSEKHLLGVTWDRLFTNVMGTPRLPSEAPAELKAALANCLANPPKETHPPAAK